MHADDQSRPGQGSNHSAHPFSHARRGWRFRLYLLPLIVLACTTLPHLDQGEFNVDTGWYSAIALQAWRSAAAGDWSALWTLQGYGGTEPYFNKPPLGFWIHGLSLWLFGPSLWAARLPSILAGAGIVTLTVSLVSRLASRRSAILAGIILAATLEFTRHLRTFSLDVWQLLFLLAAARLVVEGVRSGLRAPILLSGVPVGLALMTKPLVALLAFPILAAWMLAHRRARLADMLIPAAAIALAIAAPWHLSMVAQHGDPFTSAYFGREITSRASGSISGLNIGAEHWWYYLREVASHHWPWLATVVLSLVAWRRGEFQAPLARRAMLLGLVWSGAWLLVLSAFADKRPRYLLPVYPAWAWMSGVWIAYAAPRWVTGVRRRLRRWWPVALVTFVVVVSFLPIHVEPVRDPEWPPMFDAVRAAGLDDAAGFWDGGGGDGARGARVYMELGRWPRLAWGRNGQRLASPPAGALVLYHAGDGWGPGEQETVMFHQGQLTLTRMGDGEWRPVRTGSASGV